MFFYRMDDMVEFQRNEKMGQMKGVSLFSLLSPLKQVLNFVLYQYLTKVINICRNTYLNHYWWKNDIKPASFLMALFLPRCEQP